MAIVTTTVPTLPARPDAAEPASPGPRGRGGPASRSPRCSPRTAVLYLWGLSRSGWANAFYSAAAQAGGESWKAWFFGSSDAANAITVDKTPARAVGHRAVGAALRAEQLERPGAAGADGRRDGRRCCTRAVRRVAGPGAGLLAGAALALTPVAVLMFRFNNPDALLVLLLVGGGVRDAARGRDAGGTRWLVLAGALVGFGFLAKMLQAFLVLPALTAVWLLAAPVGLVAAAARTCCSPRVALVVSAGWWVLVVELWPAADRPVHRRLADQQRAGAGVRLQRVRPAHRRRGRQRRRRRPAAAGAQTGLTRLFGSEMGGRGVVAAAGGAGAARRAAVVDAAGRPRTDPLRAAAVLWGGWLLVTGLVFSFMAGIIHPYYTGGARAGDRRAGRARRRATLWRDRATLGGPDARWPAVARGDGGVGVRAAAAHADVAALAAWTVLGVGLVGARSRCCGVHRMPRAAGASGACATVALLAGAGRPDRRTRWPPRRRRTPGAIPSAGPAVPGCGRAGRRRRAAAARRRPARQRRRPAGARPPGAPAAPVPARGRRSARRRPRRRGRPARQPHPRRRGRRRSAARRGRLHLGRRRRRLQHRRRLPARHPSCR